MNPPADRLRTTDYLSASHHPCALCLGDLIRTPRRPIDRLWSLLVPVHRYRCSRFSCQWTGNIRVDRDAASTTPLTPR